MNQKEIHQLDGMCKKVFEQIKSINTQADNTLKEVKKDQFENYWRDKR